MTDREGRTITKRELVNRIAEDMGQTKVVVRDVLQRFLNEIIDELAQGNRLEFREFGVFEVRERAPRIAQNPRTLEKVPVPAKRVVKFKVGRVMRDRVCDEAVDAALTAGSDSAESLASGAGEAARSQPPYRPRPRPARPSEPLAAGRTPARHEARRRSRSTPGLVLTGRCRAAQPAA